tara:strand:+ start:143 stop:406 length:264 start_codon:yes stop_codon:yes gene_type:complete
MNQVKTISSNEGEIDIICNEPKKEYTAYEKKILRIIFATYISTFLISLIGFIDAGTDGLRVGLEIAFMIFTVSSVCLIIALFAELFE